MNEKTLQHLLLILFHYCYCKQNETMSGGALRNLKPCVRRRRRCEKHYIELRYNDSELTSNVDPFPVTPITPPAAFLPSECKHKTTRKKGERNKSSK